MTTFLALYRGNTVAEAKIVCVSADPELVSYIAQRLLTNDSNKDLPDSDAVLNALSVGRASALKLIAERTPESGGANQ